jgi:4-amino-4-deoxy-L-arabinose transferase-like glycosyltransferase
MLRKLVMWAVAASQGLLARDGAAVAVAAAPVPVVALPAIHRMDSARRSSRVYALVALLVPAWFFLHGLDAFPLRDNNEGLYAGVARAMLASGQYIIPHLNGVPYIEKPPLLYWLTALSMALLGPTPAAARLVSGGAMFALCLCLFQFCRMHGTARLGCFAAVGLASALPVALISHIVLFDPLLTALLGACLLCYLHSYLARSRRALRAAACLLALAVLEKGGVALVLAGGVIGLFLLMMRDRAAARRLWDPAALAILLAVSGWWHVLAATRQDGFAWFYFVNEHLLRFVGQRLPDDYHHGPAWFYLPRLVLMLLPWTPFLLLLAHTAPVQRSANLAMIRFCQAAVLFPLLFFSLAQAKAQYYLLVTAPALAMWLAMAVEAHLHGAGQRRLALCWGLAVAATLAVLLLAPGSHVGEWGPLPLLMLALGCVAMAVAGFLFFVQLGSRAGRELALLALALAAAPALALLLRAADQRAGRDSSVYVARIILDHSSPQRTVFIYRDFEDMFSSLPFYLGRPVPIIDSTSRDLQFGCKSAPGAWCVTAADFLRARAQGPVAVVVQASRARAFLAQAGPGRWRVEWVGDKMVFFDAP